VTLRDEPMLTMYAAAEPPATDEAAPVTLKTALA
jgi:hypothetical protein